MHNSGAVVETGKNRIELQEKGNGENCIKGICLWLHEPETRSRPCRDFLRIVTRIIRVAVASRKTVAAPRRSFKIFCLSYQIFSFFFFFWEPLTGSV